MRPEKKQRYLPVTDTDHGCGQIVYHAFRGTTIYIVRGRNGDMMIDTGLFHVRRAVRKWGTAVQCEIHFYNPRSR